MGSVAAFPLTTVPLSDASVPAALSAAGMVRVTELPRSPMQATYGGAFTGPNVEAAAAGGAAVDLPPTACSPITTPMIIPGGTVLRGVPGKTIFSAAAGASKNLLQNGDAAGFTIEGVTFDGNKAAQTTGSLGHAIYVLTASKLRISDCTFRNTRLGGIELVSVDDVDVLDCRFEDCGDIAQAATFRDAGVTFKGHGIRIERCLFDGTSGHAIGGGATALGQVSGVMIRGNRILTSGTFGVALGSFAADWEVSGNYIDGAGSNCIDTGACTQGIISGNTCLNAAFDGIDCDASTVPTSIKDVGLVVVGNRVRNCGRWGILVGYNASTDQTGLIVANNHVEVVEWQGIAISDVHRAVVSGNVIRNHDEAGLGFAAINFAGDVKRAMVTGNAAFEDRTTKTSNGYNDAAGDYQIVTSNDFSGCLVSFQTAAKANDIRANNR